jgi:hypothetical protein
MWFSPLTDFEVVARLDMHICLGAGRLGGQERRITRTSSMELLDKSVGA